MKHLRLSTPGIILRGRQDTNFLSKTIPRPQQSQLSGFGKAAAAPEAFLEAAAAAKLIDGDPNSVSIAVARAHWVRLVNAVEGCCQQHLTCTGHSYCQGAAHLTKCDQVYVRTALKQVKGTRAHSH